MKRFVLPVLLAGLLFSCQDKSKMLAKKWVLKEMVVADSKIEGEPLEGLFFKFKEDGTYKIVGAAGNETGKWKLTPDNEVILTTPDGETQENEIAIKELTEEKLILTGESEGTQQQFVLVPEQK